MPMRKNTLRLFDKYTHCTNVYTKLYENGRPIEKIGSEKLI